MPLTGPHVACPSPRQRAAGQALHVPSRVVSPLDTARTEPGHGPRGDCRACLACPAAIPSSLVTHGRFALPAPPGREREGSDACRYPAQQSSWPSAFAVWRTCPCHVFTGRTRRQITRSSKSARSGAAATGAAHLSNAIAKCGHCRAFIGAPVSGGRHRNHCPLCLYSRHVDGKTPGDRASSCRSLMAPVGTFFRRNGEQVIVHRCLGCGFERHCRVAADDNMVACLQLPLLDPRPSASEEDASVDEAIA
ncbi:MAG: hypothetical protein C4346_10035 [Chloroflexota bacterium]